MIYDSTSLLDIGLPTATRLAAMVNSNAQLYRSSMRQMVDEMSWTKRRKKRRNKKRKRKRRKQTG